MMKWFLSSGFKGRRGFFLTIYHNSLIFIPNSFARIKVRGNPKIRRRF